MKSIRLLSFLSVFSVSAFAQNYYVGEVTYTPNVGVPPLTTRMAVEVNEKEFPNKVTFAAFSTIYPFSPGVLKSTGTLNPAKNGYNEVPEKTLKGFTITSTMAVTSSGNEKTWKVKRTVKCPSNPCPTSQESTMVYTPEKFSSTSKTTISDGKVMTTVSDLRKATEKEYQKAIEEKQIGMAHFLEQRKVKD